MRNFVLALSLASLLALAGCAGNSNSFSEEFKTGFMEGCTGSFKENGIDAPKEAEAYCNCAYGYIKENYETPSEYEADSEAANEKLMEHCSAELDALMEAATGGQ